MNGVDAHSDDPRTISKRLDTLRAQLALKGFQLDQLACGGWLISKWNMHRQAADLKAVEAFAQQVGAA